MKTSKEIKFGSTLALFGANPDRFLAEGYKDANTVEDRLKMLSQIPGIKGVDFYRGWDINSENVEIIKELLDEYNLEPAAVTANISSMREFTLGSVCSPNKNYRELAWQEIKDTIDQAAKINCEIVNLWFGQDGYDYCFQVDYMDSFKKLVNALREAADYNPDITIAIEYKPKEPRKRLFMASAAVTLAVINEVDRSNVGIIIDTGHAFNAGENIAETVGFLKVFGDKLRYVHINDNYKTWDNDMMVGSIHVIETLEFLYWIERTGYNGFYTLDMNPYREDAVEAAKENIAIIKKLRKVLERLDEKNLNEIFSKNDSLGALAMLRENLIM